jgi:hypothetical protein
MVERVKRWLFNGFIALSTIVVLVRGGAALGFWQTPDFRGDAVHERECLDGAGSASSRMISQLGTVDPGAARYLTEERLRTVAKAFCKEAVHDSRMASRDAGTRQRAISELIRSRPEVWAPMCKLGLQVEYRRMAYVARFMSATERRRFRRDECRYRREYMAEDSMAIDLGRIAADHPEHYVPVCASGLMDSFTADRKAAARYTKRELRTIARRSCLAGLRTRVLDATGPGGFSDMSVDEGRWKLVVQRQAQSVAP